MRRLIPGRLTEGRPDPLQQLQGAKHDLFYRTDLRIAGGAGELDGLLNFGAMFWRRKLLLICLAAFGALLGFAVTLPKPIMYDARAVIETQPAQNVSGLGRQDEGVTTVLDATMRTQIETLRSGALRRAVVQRLERELAPSLPSVPPGILYRLRRYVLEQILQKQPDNPVTAMQHALSVCSNSLDARGMLGTRIIVISCESTHPEVAATYLNTLVKEFSEQEVQARRSSIEERTRWMAEQMEYLRDKLEKSEQKLQASLRSGANLPNEPDVLKQTRLQQMEQTAANLRAERTAKQLLLESAQSSSADSFVLTLEGAVLRPLYNRLQQARKEVSELSQKLTPEHIRLKNAQRQVDEIDAEFRAERGLILTQLKRDYENVEAREKAHQAVYSRQFQRVTTPADAVIEQNILQRQVELDRQLYQSFMLNIQQASLLLALPVNNARLLDPAQANLQPIQARTWTMNTLLGMFSALLAGVFWVVLREKTSQRVFSPEDVTSLLQLPELGVIPSTQLTMDDHQSWLLRLKRKSAKRKDMCQRVLSPGATDAVEEHPIELASLGQKPSLFAESFQGALASLTSLARQGIKPQALVVTSPAPKEGKSTVATNLGITLAEANHRVLLIDADLRSPRLHKILKVTNHWGLADILQEALEVEQYSLEELVKPTQITNLALVPSGSQAINPGRLFHSNRLARLITRLRREFDYIIIDTPPVLDFADARFLGRVSDGVMMVLRSGSTDRTRAIAACQRVIEDGLVLLGTVLNDWQTSGSHYGYYDRDDAHVQEKQT